MLLYPSLYFTNIADKYQHTERGNVMTYNNDSICDSMADNGNLKEELERLRANEKILVEALKNALCEIPHGTDCSVTNLVIENAKVKHEEK